MDKVYILDLRDSEAWNWDWGLAKCLKTDKLIPTQEILYTDNHNDFVLFDGNEEGAIAFFSKYCRKYGLELVSDRRPQA